MPNSRQDNTPTDINTISHMNIVATATSVRAAALTLAVAAALATGGATTAFANGHSFKTYYKFGGGNDGAGPGALAADPQGNLYGTTAAGGANGQGTIFRIAPDGSETVLYSFSSPNNTPNPGPVILDNAGNLYGATVAGGGSGRGTVYKLAPDGTETLLYSFSGGSDGGNPLGGLIVDKAGTLYGATAAGGTDGWGTVFTLTPDGTETVLYSFTGSNDGAYPFGSLIRDKAGNFYGTAGQGGINGYGTAFKLARHGTLTVLHAFGAYLSDGQTPRAGLIADQYGNFYGTTITGGVYAHGTVFELTASGSELLLYSFTGGVDGGTPVGGLWQDSTGNLYGAAPFGGAEAGGVVFKVSLYGEDTVLHSFFGGADGAEPRAALIPDGAGNLVGTTSTSFQHNPLRRNGTVFRFKP